MEIYFVPSTSENIRKYNPDPQSENKRHLHVYGRGIYWKEDSTLIVKVIKSLDWSHENQQGRFCSSQVHSFAQAKPS